MPFVLDASVAVKWYLDEDHSAESRSLLADPPDLLVPDFFYAEVANALWKRSKRGDLTRDRAAEVLDYLLAAPVEVHPSMPLMPTAFRFAAESNTAVYEMVYLALARREKCAVVTADRRFFADMRAGGHAGLVRWIADLSSDSIH